MILRLVIKLILLYESGKIRRHFYWYEFIFVNDTKLNL